MPRSPRRRGGTGGCRAPGLSACLPMRRSSRRRAGACRGTTARAARWSTRVGSGDGRRFVESSTASTRAAAEAIASAAPRPQVGFVHTAASPTASRPTGERPSGAGLRSLVGEPAHELHGPDRAGLLQPGRGRGHRADGGEKPVGVHQQPAQRSVAHGRKEGGREPVSVSGAQQQRRERQLDPQQRVGRRERGRAAEPAGEVRLARLDVRGPRRRRTGPRHQSATRDRRPVASTTSSAARSPDVVITPVTRGSAATAQAQPGDLGARPEGDTGLGQHSPPQHPLQHRSTAAQLHQLGSGGLRGPEQLRLAPAHRAQVGQDVRRPRREDRPAERLGPVQLPELGHTAPVPTLPQVLGRGRHRSVVGLQQDHLTPAPRREQGNGQAGEAAARDHDLVHDRPTLRYSQTLLSSAVLYSR